MTVITVYSQITHPLAPKIPVFYDGMTVEEFDRASEFYLLINATEPTIDSDVGDRLYIDLDFREFEDQIQSVDSLLYDETESWRYRLGRKTDSYSVNDRFDSDYRYK